MLVVTRTSRSVNPLLKRTVWQITIIVNGCGPSWDDDQSSISVDSVRRDGRPEFVLLVSQNRTCVVANHMLDPVVHPSLDDIGIVKTSDSRRNETICRVLLGRRETSLLEPSSVE